MGPESDTGASATDRGWLPPREWFATTHWSVVLQAGQGDSRSTQAQTALDQLCRSYWAPVCAYIRQHGRSLEDAQDLTQEFFAELIARNDFARVDPSRGKFRSFLLACLKHFLARVWRDGHTRKRGGAVTFIPLDAPAHMERLAWEISDGVPPEVQFDQQWALAVLDHAMTRIEQEQAAANKTASFEALKPFLVEATADSAYDAVAQRLGMSPGAVSMAVLRLRQRYREMVREAVAQTVTTPLELEDELRYLRQVLARSNAPYFH